MPTNPRPCPACGRLVLASEVTEYRNSPDEEQVTSTVVQYQCPCGNLFTCSFAAEDRHDEQGNTHNTDWD